MEWKKKIKIKYIYINKINNYKTFFEIYIIYYLILNYSFHLENYLRIIIYVYTWKCL